LQVAGDGIDETIPPGPDATVGDWLLLDRARPRSSRVLERKSLIKRRAPGTGREVQLIAANIDTVFVVTSCNADFNVARLERYVALAFEAGIDPVIVLTKADLTEDTAPYVEEARKVSDRVPVVALDARGEEPAEALADWCKPGRTVAFLGSSGVGKSTLTNALLGTQAIATQGIREDDAKGPAHHDPARAARDPRRLPRPRHAGHARIAADRRRRGHRRCLRGYRGAGRKLSLHRLPARDRARLRYPGRHRRRQPRPRAARPLAQAPGRGRLQLRQPRRTPRKGPRLRQARAQRNEGEIHLARQIVPSCRA
jgi:signal recognition particle receptor subunit beta